jgi:hypothetical protein
MWLPFPPGNRLSLLSFPARPRAHQTHGRCAPWMPLLAVVLFGLTWAAAPQRALAQQAPRLQIKVAPTIVARARSQIALPIEIVPAQAVPKRSFVSLRGLPATVALTEGHAVAPGSWAVSIADLPALKAEIPVGVTGRADILISLIALDGRMLARARTTLVVEPAAAAPPPPAGGRPETAPPEPTESRLAAPPKPEAAKEEVKAPAPPSRPVGLSAEEQERAERALAHGEEYLARGSILVARQYFQRAAEAGLATAALRLATTYDPIELERLGVSGVLPDRELARRWYERARELGSREAEERLARLRRGQ